MSIDYWEKGDSEERMAREGEETRAQGLGSQLMKELDLFFILSTRLSGGHKAGTFTSISQI